MGSEVTYNELQRAVWAEVVPNSFGNASASKNCSSSSSQVSSIMGGVNIALAVGMMVGTGGAGAVAAVAGAGAAGYIGSNASKGCDPVPGVGCVIL